MSFRGLKVESAMVLEAGSAEELQHMIQQAIEKYDVIDMQFGTATFLVPSPSFGVVIGTGFTEKRMFSALLLLNRLPEAPKGRKR